MKKFKKVSSIAIAAAVTLTTANCAINETYAYNKLSVERIAGANRVDTSREVAKKLGTKTAYFASGENFADALSIAPIAASRGEGIILTDENMDMSQEISGLGITSAKVVGGEGSVSEKIFNDIKGRVGNVERISGANRYATSLNIAKLSNTKNVGVATGRDFPDALAAGPVLATKKLPLLLIDGVKDSSLSGGYTGVYTFGGEKSVKHTFGKRVAGVNRFETSVKVAEEFGDFKTIVVASGNGYADALSSVPLAKAMNAPILLVDNKKNTLPEKTKNIMKKAEKVVIVGGTNAVSDTLKREIEAIPSSKLKNDNDKPKDKPSTPNKPNIPEQPKKPDTPGNSEGDTGKESSRDEWYGMATNTESHSKKNAHAGGNNIKLEGPITVKVKFNKDGEILNAESVKFTGDDGFQRSEGILKEVKRNNLDELLEKINTKRSVVDTYTGATISTEGYISAVRNAIQRRDKYQKDRVEQNISTIEFDSKNSRPKSVFNVNEPISYEGTVLKARMNDGSIVKIPFSEFTKYGIEVTPKEGTVYSKEEYKIERLIEVKNSLLKLYANDAQIRKKTIYKYADEILVTFKDRTTDKIKLNENDFSYDRKYDKDIEKVELFADGKKLVDGKYERTYYNRGRYGMDLKGVEVPEGYTSWRWGYTLNVEIAKPAVEFFTISDLKTEYKAGDRLDLSNAKVHVNRVGGEKEDLTWDRAVSEGFTSEPRVGTVLTDRNEEVKISVGKVSNGYKIKVNPSDKQIVKDAIPHKIQIKDSKTKKLIKEVTLDGNNTEKFKSQGGYISLSVDNISAVYSDFNKEDFEVIAFDKDNQTISTSFQKYKSYALDINITDYPISEPDKEHKTAYVRLFFNFEPVPSEIVLQDKSGKTIHSETLTKEDLKEYKKFESYGYLTVKRKINIPSMYKDVKDNPITVKVNSSDKKPMSIDFKRNGSKIEISLKEVNSTFTEGNGQLVLYLEYEDNEEQKPVPQKPGKRTGEAKVNTVDYPDKSGVKSIAKASKTGLSSLEYDIKIKIEVDKSDKIISVGDSGTVAGELNAIYWDKLVKPLGGASDKSTYLDKFVGKSVNEIDEVDTVSGSTISSNAIKGAIKKAFENLR